MAKAILTSLLTGISGKISKDSTLVFRRNPSGTTSIYRQKKHKKKSLHSPAQERQRQMLALASTTASSILANPDSEEYNLYNEQYILHCKRPRGKHFYSLRSYIIHRLYEQQKQSPNPPTKPTAF